MADMKKPTTRAGHDGLAAHHGDDDTGPGLEHKQQMIARVMREREGQGLNRFEAERLGDHCLHSTVATLTQAGYVFARTWEDVPTRFGKTAHVRRYFLLRGPGAA